MSIPYGEAGTDATVKVMRTMIEAGKREPLIRRLAERILRAYNVPRYNYISELESLHDWVRRHIRYTRDPSDIEYIQTPERLLESRMGDCDDLTVLLGSLAESIGQPVDIKVVSRDASKNFHHVYPVAEIDGHQYSLDASVPFPFGYQPPDIKKEKLYPNTGVGDMRGIFCGLGKLPPGAGGDGAAAGGTIIIGMPEDEPSVYKRPIQRPIDTPIIGPPGMLEVSTPITLREGRRLCRPDVRALFERGMIRAPAGAVLSWSTDAQTGTPCVTATLPPAIGAEGPTIFLRPPDLRKPPIKPDVYHPPPSIDISIPPVEPDLYHPPPDFPVTTLNVGQGVCHPDLVNLISQGLIKAAPGAVLKVTRGALGQEDCVSAVSPADVVVPERPTVFMQPPTEALPAEYRGAAVAMVDEKGPLGLPWIVWIGAAGLLVTVLMKK